MFGGSIPGRINTAFDVHGLKHPHMHAAAPLITYGVYMAQFSKAHLVVAHSWFTSRSLPL